MAFGILALMVASLFTGAGVYVTVVEHPARLMLDPGAQLEGWKPSYARSAAMRWGKLHAMCAVLGVASTALLAWAAID